MVAQSDADSVCSWIIRVMVVGEGDSFEKPAVYFLEIKGTPPGNRSFFVPLRNDFSNIFGKKHLCDTLT